MSIKTFFMTLLFGRSKNMRRKGSEHRKRDHAAIMLPPGNRPPESIDYSMYDEPCLCHINHSRRQR